MIQLNLNLTLSRLMDGITSILSSIFPVFVQNPAWGDFLYIQISGTLVHSSPNLSFTIYDSSEETTFDESFGIKDINLSFVTGANSHKCTLGESKPYPTWRRMSMSKWIIFNYFTPGVPACAPYHSYCELYFGS